jgi:hypothetical protein
METLRVDPKWGSYYLEVNTLCLRFQALPNTNYKSLIGEGRSNSCHLPGWDFPTLEFSKFCVNLVNISSKIISFPKHSDFKQQHFLSHSVHELGNGAPFIWVSCLMAVSTQGCWFRLQTQLKAQQGKDLLPCLLMKLLAGLTFLWAVDQKPPTVPCQVAPALKVITKRS